MTGAQAMSSPIPGRPRRNSKMPRMGAANVAMKAAHQTMAAPASPCMPSGPPPKMKPESATRSAASARSATTAMAQKIFTGLPSPAFTDRPWPGSGHTFGAHGQAALVRTLLTLFTVTRCQNLRQRRQASAQARDTMRNQVGHAIGVVRTSSDALRQVD
jgi:hypothetical protein